MHRSANVIRMLLYLKSHGLVKKDEIAQYLEVNERNISEYRKELVYAGYDIDIIPGKDGGYRLNSDKLFPVMQFTPDETTAMVLANRYLENNLTFTMRESFKNAVIKVLHLEPDRPLVDYTMVDGVAYKADPKEMENWFYIAHNSITSHIKLLVSYRTSMEAEKEKVVHPHELFRYRNMWYLIVKSDTSDHIFTLKFNRIIRMKQVNERFEPTQFDREDFINDFGINLNAPVLLKLKLTGAAKHYAKEYLYGANQIEVEHEDHLELSFMVNSPEQAKHIALNFGKDCEVVSPDSVLKLVKEEIEGMSKLYYV